MAAEGGKQEAEIDPGGSRFSRHFWRGQEGILSKGEYEAKLNDFLDKIYEKELE